MSVKLLTEHHLEFLSLKGGCKGSSESTLVKMPHSMLDLDLISIASLGPRASTKVESHVNFTESQKVSQPNFFCNIKHREVS